MDRATQEGLGQPVLGEFGKDSTLFVALLRTTRMSSQRQLVILLTPVHLQLTLTCRSWLS